jgi:hypothetical protein
MVEETPVFRPTARGSLRLPIAELRGLLGRAGQFAKRSAGPLSLCYDGRMAKIKVVVEITLAHLKPESPDVKVTVERETLSPEQLDNAARDTPLRSTQSGTALDDKAR